MVKKLAFLVILLAMIAAILLPYNLVLAARGIPGSTEFGFGAHLRLQGPFVAESARLAGDLQLDWLAVEIPWQTLQPKKGQAVDWSAYAPILEMASHNSVALFASLTRPPDWALTSSGPDSTQVVQFTQQITRQFGGSLKALEVFPGANTRAGWGTTPNAKAYLDCFRAVQAALQASQMQVLLVAGGLLPAGTRPAKDMVDDISFLASLYKAGAKAIIPVISVQLGQISGSPMAPSSGADKHVLRHYEEIRQVMLENGHERGLVWVTHLQPPDGSLSADDAKFQNPEEQSTWLTQAFQQMRSQLYIGVAFLDAINPDADNPSFSLITPGGDFHPAYRLMRDQIAQNSSGSIGVRPGRPKAAPLARTH